MAKAKVIAFYLPQFHPIPENDRAHGKGFTEWTNVKKAKPLFQGHYQPRVPLNENYYSLLDPAVMREQAKMAKQYGIYGFCYYHYWFKNGKKLLEKPVEMMLKDKTIDIPFCLCWANENWTRRWDGENNEIIVEQDYGDLDDLNNHIDYLCSFFEDDRYIKIDGKPVLVIYKPEIIPNLKMVVRVIRQRIEEKGFPGVVLMSQYPDYYFSCARNDEMDNYIQFQPQFARDFEVEKQNLMRRKIKHIMQSHHMNKLYQALLGKYQKKKKKQLTCRSYEDEWKSILEYPVSSKKVIAGAFVDWDNTSRNVNGIVYKGANPNKFYEFFKKLAEKVDREYSTDYIFINAWNEWAEGAYLEPDQKFGYGYLEAVKKVLQND